MKTTFQETDDQIVVILSGEMDTAAALEMENAMKSFADSKGRDIIIDCTDLSYIASSGLRILLSILKQAKEAGSRVVLKNVNDVIKEVLELTGFVKLFDFE